mmetsp:Transcript_5837/g.13817  ORF Transcript_5837/g.13817 Transcript_5837/m.13817 type:complete len:172 (-) Transcript_5837:80-595(-)
MNTIFGTIMLLKLLLLMLNLEGVQSFQYTTPMPSTSRQWKQKQNFVRIQNRSSLQPRKVCNTFGGMELNLSKNNSDEEKGIPFLASAIGISVLLAAWPLLTFLRDVNNPTDGFDVDMFMTLKGMLDTNGSSDNNSISNMSMLTDDNYRSIVELPALSPAEQLVGAFFGPPR